MVSVLAESHYIPGEKPLQSHPLDRFLPPIYKQVVPQWLKDRIPAHGWLLDPFGASPELVVEAASHGYRVLVSANNPVNRLILEILSNQPSQSDFQAALAFLASQQVGQDRLEPHIKSLYETNCIKCHHPVDAREFIWQREERLPVTKIYTCHHCGDEGERPVVSADLQKVEIYNKTSLHKARALERVAPLHDPDRLHVKDALNVYLPRAIYAIVTIINKLGNIPTTESNRPLLDALLLLAFDRANTLWLYPKERQRPRQLTIPSHFREHNIWMALESAARLWQMDGPPVSIVRWPSLPPQQGGISLYDGRIKELASSLSDLDIQAILTSFPRPNQAFWTLSALWSGWLWGHEAVEPYKSVLRRRRYDWGWHTTAIRSALSSLGNGIAPGTPYFGMVTEIEPGFLASVILGARLANLELSSLALRVEDGLAQIEWKHPSHEIAAEGKMESTTTAKIIQSQAQHYLLEVRGEPSPYTYIHAVGLAGIARNPYPENIQSPHEYLSQVQSEYPRSLSFRNGFLRYGGSDKSLEVGLWWTSSWNNNILPLADRTEVALVKHLSQNPGTSLAHIDRAVCKEFPGISPPEPDMIQMCLQSYGYQENPEADCWHLHDREVPGKRRKDIETIATLIKTMGQRLGFKTIQKDGFPPIIQWIKSQGSPNYQFMISASALLGKFIQSEKKLQGKAIMIIPGSRANLIAYKLNHNPYYPNLLDKDSRFVKYRHIRLLFDNPNLNPTNLDEHLFLDPLTYTQPQIRLL